MTSEHMKSLGIPAAELAIRLGLSRSAISMKVNGRRPWSAAEARAVLNFVRETHPEMTFEDLFSEEPADQASETDERLAAAAGGDHA